jgi:YfiH family protein
MTLPEVPEPFYWIDAAWGHALRCRALDPVALHLFATRQLQLSSTAHMAALASSVGAVRVQQVTQVHGRAHLVVRAGDAAPAGDPPEADLIVSNAPGVAVAVRAADCVPVLIADRESGAVAAVHAGWRGTCARAAPAAVSALRDEFGARPENLVAAIGPSIGVCCYEVGPELVDAFAAAGHERHLIQRWFPSLPPPRGSRTRNPLRLDVAGANRDQLVLAGVPEDQIFLSGLCTAMHLDVLTSYRAEKEKAGRLVAAISGSRLTATGAPRVSARRTGT